MSVLDAELELSDAQAVTSTAASTNTIDLGQVAPNLGKGGVPLYLVVEVSVAATADGSATLDLAVQDSADNSSFANIHTVPQIAVAALTAGARLMTFTIPLTHRQYVRLNYTIGTGPLTAGNFKAYLTTAPN